jgi:hypothetical protein
MFKKRNICMLACIPIIFIVMSCSEPLPWPKSPLHVFPALESGMDPAMTMEQAVRSIVGHYAHYDVVSYEDTTTKTPMRTFVISYGFTDFFIEGNSLYQKDRFLHAENKINQKNVESVFKDSSVQAIQPRVQKVELEFRNGAWHIYRPPSPTLLGIQGNPNLPLSRDPNDPNLLDPDGDGNPGVTVELTIANLIRGKLFITRREIYSDHLVVYPDRRIHGWVEDASEQFVIGANMKILRQQSNSVQVPDPGMNPIILVPVDESIDTWEELQAIIPDIFPKEPDFGM